MITTTFLVKVALCFFSHGEECAFERHRSQISVSCEKHRSLTEMKKHLTDFLEMNKQGRKYDLGAYQSSENFAILTHGHSQWEMELPSLIKSEGCVCMMLFFRSLVAVTL